VVNADLIVDFVNTAGFGPDREDLPTPVALAEWLRGHGLDPGARVSRADYDAALSVREALRDLMSVNNGVPADVAAATEILDDAARRADYCVRFVDGGARLAPDVGGVRGAVGTILAEVFAAMSDGSWARLKACRADDCRYAFFDGAKNASRAWCSMRSCGNRAKVSAYRARHH
jgi:predicted RNA-binding Zn ribbon-like protein